MPYQLRHVDETIVVDEQDHFNRFPVDSLLEIKVRDFEPQTRLFELLLILCAGIAVGAAIVGLEATLPVLLMLATTGGAVVYLMRQRQDLGKLASHVPGNSRRRFTRLRSLTKRGRSKRPPFVNYA